MGYSPVLTEEQKT